MEFIDNIYFIYREKYFDKYYILWAFFRARKHMDSNPQNIYSLEMRFFNVLNHIYKWISCHNVGIHLA